VFDASAISLSLGAGVENPVSAADVRAEPPGNSRVLWISSLAFALGFAVWGMFAALAPFLIKWYDFSATQVLVLTAMEPFFAAAVRSRSAY
jgi:NNP family nitrate/nitrite transporter-like MFS transporter